MSMRLLTAGEVERQILSLSDRLEDETNRYADVAELAALAEADFKGCHARALLAFADATVGSRKATVDERRAQADLDAEDAYAIYRLNEARLDACKQALYSLRTRLDALRTLAANIRAQS